MDFCATFFNAKKSFWDYTTTMKVGILAQWAPMNLTPVLVDFMYNLKLGKQEKFAESAVGSQLLLGIRVEPA